MAAPAVMQIKCIATLLRVAVPVAVPVAILMQAGMAQMPNPFVAAVTARGVAVLAVVVVAEALTEVVVVVVV
jgi:hypothetical protein